MATHQNFPAGEGIAIISWQGDWSCRCGSVNKLWADCLCGQGAPCREYVRGHCRMARCRYPHPAFHIPDTPSRPDEPIAHPRAGPPSPQGALPRSTSAKFAPKVVTIVRTLSGSGAPKQRSCAPNEDSPPKSIRNQAAHWQCTCGTAQKFRANCNCGQPAPCREWVCGSCQRGERCRHPHPDFHSPPALPHPAIVRPLPATEMQSPFNEMPVSPMGQLPPVATWSSLKGVSDLDHTLAQTPGGKKDSDGGVSLAGSGVEQAPIEESNLAPSSASGRGQALESDGSFINSSEATTPLTPSPRDWPLFEINTAWSPPKAPEDNNNKQMHDQSLGSNEQGKISTSGPKDVLGLFVGLVGKDAWSGGVHVQGSRRSSSASIDWTTLSPLGSTPSRPELSRNDLFNSGCPPGEELGYGVVDSVLPPPRLTVTSSHVLSGQPSSLSTQFLNDKGGNGLDTTSEDASKPTALHQVGITLLQAGLLDPAFFFALSSCNFLPLCPAPGLLSAFEKRQRCEQWNSAIDVYISAGLDLRPGPIIETAAKLGLEGGPMNPHLGDLLPSQKALQLGLEAFVVRGLEGAALQEATLKLLSVADQLVLS